MDFLQNYPADPETQGKLLDELDQYLSNLTPEKVFEPRFMFLLKYFELHSDDFLKEVCSNWIERIDGR